MDAYGGGPVPRYSSPARLRHKPTERQRIHTIPTAVTEIVLLGGFIAMNYCFRFDPSARNESSLVDGANVILYPSDLIPSRPFYNYSLSHDDPEQIKIGITFGMPEYAFFVTTFVFPLLLIVTIETIRYFVIKKEQGRALPVMGIAVNLLSRRIGRFYLSYLMYGSFAGLIAAFVKLFVVSTRPHFLEVCEAQDVISTLSFNVSTCGNANVELVYEALRSFPSYHATIAVYGGTFTCLYLHYCAKIHGVRSLVGLFWLPVLVMTLIGALHRMVTYHNSLTDVFWGALLGLCFAFYAVFGQLNTFTERVCKSVAEKPKEAEPTSPVERVNPAFVKDHFGDHDLGNRSTNVFYQQKQQPPNHKVNQVPPVGRPAPAFNHQAFADQYPPQPVGGVANYNTSRQRLSLAPRPPSTAPSRPMNPPTRPLSAHPLARPAPHRSHPDYEGASYF